MIQPRFMAGKARVIVGVCAASVVFLSCKTGRVDPSQRDEIGPMVTLQAQVPNQPHVRVQSNQFYSGAREERLTVRAGQLITLTANATHPAGVTSLRIYDIGDTLQNRAMGEVRQNPGDTLSRTFGTVATVRAVAGRTLRFYATGYKAGFTAYGSNTPYITITVEGNLDPLPSGHREHLVSFRYDEANCAFTYDGAQPPESRNPRIVGLRWNYGGPFDFTGGVINMRIGATGLRRASDLNIRTDYLRFHWRAEYTHLFNGRWGTEPWYVLHPHDWYCRSEETFALTVFYVEE